jgi:hypothetical protein
MHRYRYIGAAILLSFAFQVNAQGEVGTELVRNGSFEQITKTPNTYDQITHAIGWKNVTLALSELFDPNASPKTVGIPVNDYGTMEPFEGERYAGFMGWKDDVRNVIASDDPEVIFKPGWNSYSEYIQGELITPLIKGVTYEVSFQVALAGNSDRSIMGIGALAWKHPQPLKHRKFMEEIPDVFSDEIITEREKWTEIRGKFKAEGGEQVIVIGVFPYVGLESETIIEGRDNRYAYYYLDAVSLKRLPEE